MKKLIFLAAIIFGSIGQITAQSNLYVSPAANKTANNSIVVTPDGNVGIGKANPETKLEVNGRIHAKSVKVDLEGWADFVFALDYELLPLLQVEAYINKHGHLPAVPSEKEALTNGMDVAQMNVILLQKVEELTLYMIQKEKEVQALEKRLEAIEAKLNK
ncbi:MAG: hypothetical protein ABJM06_01370 [Gilvibacter sp.]